MGPMPEDPDANGSKGIAISLSVLVKDFIAEGFPRNEALYLASVVMTGNPGSPPENPDLP